MATTSRSSDDLRNLVRRELLACALRDGDDGWVTFNELVRLLPPSVPLPRLNDALDFLKSLGVAEEKTLLIPAPSSDPRVPRRATETVGFRLTRAALVDLLRDALALSRSRGEGLLAALRQFESSEVSR